MHEKLPSMHTPSRRQSKMPVLSRNVDQKSLETEFLIAICRHTDDKWQSKTLFLSIFDPRSSIVDSVFDCHLPGVMQWRFFLQKDFYQLKELERMCQKEKGITSMSVKEILTSLVDDGMVDTDKIGTSVYFWAFPSKASQNVSIGPNKEILFA